MKTKLMQLQCGSLIAAISMGMTAINASSQAPNPYPKEPLNYPAPDQPLVPGLYTNLSPQRFLSEAGWNGIKEIRLSEIAIRKTLDSEVRNFAQLMVSTHSKANSELREVARRKGYHFPAGEALETVNVNVRTEATGVRENIVPEPNPSVNVTAADRTKRDPSIGNHRVDGVRDPLQSTNQVSDAASWQDVLSGVRRLEGAPEAAFDRVYLQVMLKDHDKAMQLFEAASRQMEDVELQQFASATLPKLREHANQAEKLAQAKGAVAGGTDKTSEPRR